MVVSFFMANHTNRLINESSPYLLQHAHNPVDWYPWGPEALQKAKDEDKPILVSIGYSACHWCHVMEKESFEDETVAELMNRDFINIKIDREERPDLDHIYMDALQAMTGSGGWPLNIFLTPAGKPFYGGTYFPPRPVQNRPSWSDVLYGIATAYKERKDEINEQAEEMVAHLEKTNGFGIGKTPDNGSFSRDMLHEMKTQLMANADKQWGGFGRAPKFPQTFIIQYLLQYYYYFRDEESLKQALLSIDKMIQGGIYDQVGGGFARYSTDGEWLAPHFEKMTYDNALLLSVIADAYAITNDEGYAAIIKETLDFMFREMMTEEKGFYAALDADSEGVEGKFYTWSRKEFIDNAGLEGTLIAELYGITEEGNWEHTNIPWLKETPAAFAAKKGFPVEMLKKHIATAKHLLLEHRSKRIRPQTDDKCLLGWNALMNTALTKCHRVVPDDAYLGIAEQNMQFIFNRFYNEATGEWYHTFKNGTARYPAFLDDYAYLIQALIALHESTGKIGYLQKAEKLTGEVISLFTDDESPMFFYTRKDQEDVIIRKKEVYDGAVPSGNAVMAFNLHRLGILIDNSDWGNKSTEMALSVSEMTAKYPSSFGLWAALIAEKAVGTSEIVLLGGDASLKSREILREFIPNKVFQWSAETDETLPLLKGKPASTRTVYYLCREYSCKKPVNNSEELLQLIEKDRLS
jgi:uncharacterized protein YyaL (SSP411 family)